MDGLLYPAKKIPPIAKSDTEQEKAYKNVTSSKVDPLLKPNMETTPASLSSDFKKKVVNILLKYSSGLWANALPKLYQDTYQVKFPEDILNNLELLSDVCIVDYVSEVPRKAILYAKPQRRVDENLNVTEKVQRCDDVKATAEQQYEESKDQYPENITVPPLIIPSEGSVSVMVLELKNTNEVLIRQVCPSESMFFALFISQHTHIVQVCCKRTGQQEVAELCYLLILIMKLKNPFICVLKWKFSETFSVLSWSVLSLACLKIKADMTCHWKTSNTMISFLYFIVGIKHKVLAVL